MKKKILTIIIVFIFSITLVACNEKEYVDYMSNYDGYESTIGDSTNSESFVDMKTIYNDNTADNIKVLPVNLKDDFIVGVDISSILDVENAGGKFYNDLGEEQDVFEILKEKGVNYVRLRHWNEPYTEDNLPYGGGNNHLETNITIAKRAARVGMRFLLDFHYSDFWADPGKQTIPRAWKDLSENELETEIYNYTYDVIKEFEDAGVRPHMVQIGNEINNGFLFPIAPVSRGYRRIANYLKQGIKAVNDVSEDILTAVHLAEGASEQSLIYFFDKMVENDVEFDIIGLSYYSFWHGDIETFRTTLKSLDERYEQDIVVMEYSYGFTNKDAEHASHIFSEEQAEQGGYKATFQGQASYIRDVNDAVNSIENGIGSFYWEPAWLPVANAGWASNGARKYLQEQGDDVSALGAVSWANQALFTFSGQASPALNVFNLMKTSTFDQEEVLSYQEELSIVLNLRANEPLPSSTVGFTSLDRMTTIPVTWNQSQVDEMISEGAGEYLIEGLIKSGEATLPITLKVNAYENYIHNASFEEGGRVTSDVRDFSLIEGWDVQQSANGVVKVESKNPRRVDNSGFNNINVYHSSNYTFELYQKIELEAGVYELAVWGRSDTTGGVSRPDVKLFTKLNNEIIKDATVLYGPSWSAWERTILQFTITETSEIIIGLEGGGNATSWAHFDDFTLEKVG